MGALDFNGGSDLGGSVLERWPRHKYKKDCEEALADNEKFPSLCTAPGVGVGPVCFGTAEASKASERCAGRSEGQPEACSA